MKTQIRLIVAIAFLMAPIVILAQERGERGQRRGTGQEQIHQRGDRMAQALELTEDQKTQIEDIHTAQMKASLQTRNKLNEHRAKLQSLRTEDVADIKAINKTIDEMSELEATLKKSREASHQEVRKLLTEEQRIKFDAMSSRMMANRGAKGRQGRGGKGHGSGRGYGSGGAQ